MCRSVKNRVFGVIKQRAVRRLDTGEPVKPVVVPRPKAYNPSRIINPFTRVDSPEDFIGLGVYIDAPEGSEDVYYSVCLLGFATVGFKYCGHEYLLRASRSEDDFMGIYGETVSVRTVDEQAHAVLTEIAADGMIWYKLCWDRDDARFILGCTDGASEEEVLAVCRRVKAFRTLE